MSLERQDRLTIGRARARLRDAIRQLDLALERGDKDDDWEAEYRVALAAGIAYEGSRTCRLLAGRLERRHAATLDTTCGKRVGSFDRGGYCELPPGHAGVHKWEERK